MVSDRAMPEQSCQERQRMVGKRRIYEWLLSFQRFHRTAARQTVVVERRIDQFWEQFGDGSQPGSRALVLPVPGLTKHELPARRMISQVEPKRNATSRPRHLLSNHFPGRAAIYATDQDVHPIHACFCRKVVRLQRATSGPRRDSCGRQALPPLNVRSRPG